MSRWWNAHAHSKFSVLDAMPEVDDMVTTAVEHGQPALALTDHGLMSGTFQLYRACKKAGILPFPGIEAYFVTDVNDRTTERYHLGLLALSHEGYKALVHLSSLSYQRERFHYKPRIDFNDLSAMADVGALNEVVITTGCYFGMTAQTLIHRGMRAATGVVQDLASTCPNVFVELQHHHTTHISDDDERATITDDTELAESLCDLADRVGLPVLVTQDSHYTCPEHKRLHDFYKRIAYASSNRDDSFPGDSYHLAHADFVKGHFSGTKKLRAAWNENLDSCDWLIDNNRLSLPALDKYKFQVPIATKNPDRDLRKRCERAMKLRKLTDDVEYVARLDRELAVIGDAGFASYFLLVSEIVGYCWSNDIIVNTRGSAVGSLVCWLLNITRLDPIEWDLLFERFMSKDRTKPPDIDLDIEDRFRDQVIEWIKDRWHGALRLGTFATFSIDFETGLGSLVQQYFYRLRHEASQGVAGSSPYNFQSDIHTIADRSPADAEKLFDLHEMRLRKSTGTHASGIILESSVHPISDYLPIMYIPSSETYVTQHVMEDVEDAGYVKIDVLGVRALTTVHATLDTLGRDVGDFCDWIPMDDRQTMTLLRRGRTKTGIFQFEGYSSASGCKEVGVKTVRDLVLVNALYRPATIEAGHKDTYIRNRNDPSKVRYIHPFFEEHLAETFGVPVYQEQVMSILRGIGFDVDELNQMLKAVKASNDKIIGAEATFRKLHDRFLTGCRDQGMSDKQAHESWSLVQTFSTYSFNRAHSTAYALLGYWMAYLKVHHPIEFHGALLAVHTGDDKESQYMVEARRCGIKLKGVDINFSGANWKVDSSGLAVRKGFSSLKGIKKAGPIIEANQPFKDLDDVLDRVPGRALTGGAKYKKTGEWTGMLKTLAENGAFAQFGVKREDVR